MVIFLSIFVLQIKCCTLRKHLHIYKQKLVRELLNIYWESAKKYGNMDFKVILNR